MLSRLAPVLIRDSLRISAGLARHAVTASARGAREAPSLLASAMASPRRIGAAERTGRQVWAAGGLAMVEVRGLDRGDLPREAAAAAVQAALRSVEGIRWARVDAATSRAAVRYDIGRHSVAGLDRVLAQAEQHLGVSAPPGGGRPGSAGVDESRRATTSVGPRPAGGQDLRMPPVDAVGVAADAIAAVAASAARLLRLPTLPATAPALVALIDQQPWLRGRLERRLGKPGADLSLTLVNAAVLGLAGSVAPLLVDAALRAQALRARHAVEAITADRRAEPTEADGPDDAIAVHPDARPTPLPAGPVDKLVSRAASGSLLVSGGVLATTADPDLAGRALLAGLPRAAVVAREAFADTLTIGLARRGVPVLDREAVRRLDRLTTVIVDSAVLHGDRRQVVRARAMNAWTTERVWRTAQRLLESEDGRPAAPAGWPPAVLVRSDPAGPAVHSEATSAPSPVALTRRLLTVEGQVVGEVMVGHELDPLADAVLSAVREAGLRLLLTTDPAAPHLSSRVDEVLQDPGGQDGWLRRQVRRLQADGEVVAVISSQQQPLAAADVGIGVVPATGRVPWVADVLCDGGLRELPRLLAAAPAARAISEHGVRLSLAATFLSSLLLAAGASRHRRGGLAPISMAAAVALVTAARAARRVDGLADPQPIQHTAWHALDPDEVLDRLPWPGPVSSEDETARGASALTRGGRLVADLVTNVRAELADPLTPVLATGAAASAVIGSPADSLLVGGVLVGSALISGAQRMRSDRALRDLLLDQRLPGRVVDLTRGDRSWRGSGSARTVPAAGLLPGHVIDLRAGDVVPADGRLLHVDELEVDEATLTGESTPVGKQVTATPGAELPDRACMVYEGTTVVAGVGRAVVIAVGPATEAGRATALAGRAAPPPGMQARLEELTSKGLPTTLIGGAAVAGLALLRGQTLRSAIGSGVAVAVAAVPEGLPLMATVAQLGAARRLSRRGVLARASRTVEALGRVSTICFDKTGTLTEGRLTLVRVADLNGQWPPDAPPARRTLWAAAHAGPRPHDQHGLTHATDQAVLDAARTILGGRLDEEWEGLAEVPFHSERKFSAAVGRTPSTVRLVIKGAPEVILPRCSHVRDDEGKHRLERTGGARAVETVHELASRGLRVLAVARRNVADVAEAADPEEIAELGDLTLLGFIGLADTARPSAASTVSALRRAGIRPVMITGDHPVTARAIAASLGIPTSDLVTGPQLGELDEAARIEQVRRAAVFARVSPEQKLQIVEALQRDGQVVAMAGDGANDAAAIRLADVGIGIAARGSTSARTAADLVLTEPDLRALIDALVEGRAMWQRVRDAVAVLLGGNVGEIAFTLAGTALAGRAPISTRQFLVVNMFTDLLPSMALALTPTPTEPAQRAAVLSTGPPSLGRPLLHDIGFRGAVTSTSALLAWSIGRFIGTQRRAGTIGLATIVGAELGQTLLLGGGRPLVVGMSLGSALALVAMIQTPGVSRFFDCTPLGPVAWTVVLVCSMGATVASVARPRLASMRAAWPTAGSTARELC